VNKKSEPFVINQRTRTSFRSVKLVNERNEFQSNIPLRNAIQAAQQAGLDLVCFKPDGDQPLCKIIDFGKWKYNDAKRKKKEKSSQKKTTKELRFSLLISENDVNHKLKQAIEFLDEGDDVLFTMRLKGRDRVHFDDAVVKMNTIIAKCEPHGKEVSRKQGGGMISVRLAK
jgi:translation initiation factor IF-3